MLNLNTIWQFAAELFMIQLIFVVLF